MLRNAERYCTKTALLTELHVHLDKHEKDNSHVELHCSTRYSHVHLHDAPMVDINFAQNQVPDGRGHLQQACQETWREGLIYAVGISTCNLDPMVLQMPCIATRRLLVRPMHTAMANNESERCAAHLVPAVLLTIVCEHPNGACNKTQCTSARVLSKGLHPVSR